MLQLIPRLFLTRMAARAQRVTHSQRYQLEEQIIHQHTLSKKNQLRLVKLRKAKANREQEKHKAAAKHLHGKQQLLRFNDLHGLESELKRMQAELHSISDVLSNKELNHYKTRIEVFSEIIKKKKEQIKKKQ